MHWEEIMTETNKKEWTKPELVVISESEVDEHLLGSGNVCFDDEGNVIPC